ncbi:hypothetical protein [Streptomyces sp. S.PNR 29]|uniref:hypothetical protein n=1 Tax=Streptomyces sp. S.PNR 29 TaxID=2973805 RepID=UPI0025B0A3C9|nr:hypothetical protein [Streptomyces sp. S.PNR 29]MDN0200413.1 hypothetical protein [Streptomyces sp. S.PNR 29]
MPEAEEDAGHPEADGDGLFPDDPDGSASPDEAGLVPSAPPLRHDPGTVSRAERRTEPVLHILPLGSGLVLIGLGLGLAFVALRLRRA